MIIIKLYGGLGNQMFQYALGKSIEIRKNIEAQYYFENPEGVFSKYEYSLNIFKLKQKAINKDQFIKKTSWDRRFKRIIKKILLMPINKPFHVFHEKRLFFFDKHTFNIYGNLILNGYWQSYKYFENIEDIVRRDFVFKYPLTGTNKKIEKLIKKNSVSIHVRRGDYVIDKKAYNVHGTCPPLYYEMATKFIENRIKDPQYFVFSDDIMWTKKSLKLPKNTIYIDWNKNNNNYRDMQLMSLCKHNIIANSSFSWWGAWLNSNPNKIVIAPKRWFRDKKTVTKDLIEPSWTRI